MEVPKFTEQEKKHLAKSAMAHVIPGGARNADLEKGVKIFTDGEGCYLYDIHGNKYLDSFASLLTSICGHRRPEIKQAVMEQMDCLEFFPNYRDTFTVPLIKLGEKLAEVMPGDLSVAFFTNSGSEANEMAIKMARQYHWENGQRHRYKVISRRYAYHGVTLGAVSNTGFTKSRECNEPLLPGAIFVPSVRCYDCELDLKAPSCNLACLKAMEKTIQWEGPESISAVIMDPLPASNIGYPLPPDGYLQGVRELCDKHGILLIFDEVQSGFGKTGKWFACEHWNVTPDFMTVSKAITAGYLPLGAAVTTNKIADAFRNSPGTEFRSICTYGGHTLSCAAALASLKIMQEEKLVERAAETGKYLKAELEKLYNYKIVSEIRGLGMLWAIEMMADAETKTKLNPKFGVGDFIRDWCWENGMILRNNGDTLVIAPPLVITKEEIDLMLGRINQAIQAAMKHFGL